MKTISFFALILFFALTLDAANAEEKQLKQTVSAQPTILSIIPALAEPGSKVMISGTNLGVESKAFLGSEEITPATSSPKQLEFIIPEKLSAGVYALYIKRNDGITSRPYNFSVIALRPQINSLSPDSIASCSQGSSREITITGRNFASSSQTFFDGVIIPSQQVSSETITFKAPAVAGGLHNIMVKNGADNASESLGLMIETKPDIAQVRIGSEFVNYYELIIEGRNFQQNSTILVDGMRIGGKGDDLAAREKVIYLGCTQLIYHRHPYSPTTKEYRLQVVNSGGEGSQVVTVSAP